MLNPAQISELRFLLIQDDRPTDPTLEKVAAAPGMTREICPGVEHAHAALSVAEFDVILLNLGNPSPEVLRFLNECRERYPMTATVMIADLDNTHLAVQSAGTCASDYFVRPLHPDAVIVRMQRAVAMRRAEHELEERRLQLESMLHARIEESQIELKRLEQTSEQMFENGHAEGRVNTGKSEMEALARAILLMSNILGLGAI